ncbi:MAG TPA: YbaK/EbsC family protein [Actinomycetota bacterium]|nr:YbaK/EbsC family protein [Actinomycetota bacterium]
MRTSVDVHNFLLERDVPHEVFVVRGRLRSPRRIPALLGLSDSEVGRVVLLEDEEGPVAAVLPVAAPVDLAHLRSVLRRPRLSLATPERCAELTEFLPESVPPAGLPEPVRVVVDRSLARPEVLYFPGGEVRSVLKVQGSDLVRATGAAVAALVPRDGRPRG